MKSIILYFQIYKLLLWLTILKTVASDNIPKNEYKNLRYIGAKYRKCLEAFFGDGIISTDKTKQKTPNKAIALNCLDLKKSINDFLKFLKSTSSNAQAIVIPTAKSTP